MKINHPIIVKTNSYIIAAWNEVSVILIGPHIHHTHYALALSASNGMHDPHQGLENYVTEMARRDDNTRSVR